MKLMSAWRRVMSTSGLTAVEVVPPEIRSSCPPGILDDCRVSSVLVKVIMFMVSLKVTRRSPSFRSKIKLSMVGAVVSGMNILTKMATSVPLTVLPMGLNEVSLTAPISSIR